MPDIADQIVGHMTEEARRELIRSFMSFTSRWTSHFIAEHKKNKEERKTEKEKRFDETHPLAPFGSRADAKRFVDICKKNGILDIEAKMGKGDTGYVQYDAADAERIAACFEEWATTEHDTKLRQVQEAFDRARTVKDRSKYLKDNGIRKNTRLNRLIVGAAIVISPIVHPLRTLWRFRGYIHRVLSPLYDNVGRYQGSTPDSARDGDYNKKCAVIAKAVDKALSQAHDLDEFSDILSQRSVGMSFDAEGKDYLYYLGRQDQDGHMLPYNHGEMDFAIGAEKLRDNWGVNATVEAIESNNLLRTLMDDVNDGIAEMPVTENEGPHAPAEPAREQAQPQAEPNAHQNEAQEAQQEASPSPDTPPQAPVAEALPSDPPTSTPPSQTPPALTDAEADAIIKQLQLDNKAMKQQLGDMQSNLDDMSSDVRDIKDALSLNEQMETSAASASTLRSDAAALGTAPSHGAHSADAR